jgi:glycogenin glucosyltransferase
LEQLARKQSEVLAAKLGGDESTREIPTRPLPYGSEGIKNSPTYVAQTPSSGATTNSTVELTPRVTFQEPSYEGPPVLAEKGETFPSKSTPEPATEEELDAIDN